MRRDIPRVSLLILSVLLLCVAAMPFISTAALQDHKLATSSIGPKLPRPQFLPGEILVRFRKDSIPKETQIEMSVFQSGRQLSLQIERLGEVEIVEGLRLAHVAAEDTVLALQALRRAPGVLYAEPNFLRFKETAPNDPLYGDQWALKNTGQFGGTPLDDINAEAAWLTTTGSRDVVVGVVDEGMDINHPDLRDNVWTNPGEVPGNGVDDDADGFVDDVHGWDFVHNDNTVFDYALATYPPPPDYALDIDDHGTHVAGTIGAAGNNGTGVAGVNWQVSLLALKFLGPDGTGSTANLLKALAYAKTLRELWVNSGGTKGANIRVLNNSYGGLGFSQAELDAINELAGKNILFVAAAGNDGVSNDLIPHYPASYPAANIISVGATDDRDLVPSFTDFGNSVHLSAPGLGILSTTPLSTYFFGSGTSMACPHVAGAAALLLTVHPESSLATLRSAMMFNGRPIDSQYSLSGRRLDILGSLIAFAENDTTPPAAINDLHVGLQSRQTVFLNWTAPGDDGSVARAVLYEIRFSDAPLTDPVAFDQAKSLARMFPADPGSFEQIGLQIPLRHTSGFIGIRALDNLGNKGPIASVAVSDSLNIGDPYTISETAPAALSTGGTPLGIVGDETSRSYGLPFDIDFFGNMPSSFITVSANGAIYIPIPPNFSGVPTGPSGELISTQVLDRYTMIAGLWDDLRTDRRPGDDVYVVPPDAAHPDRIIFRWQAVTYDTPIGPGVTRGQNPVNFEIELNRDGTIVIRYGDGNQKVFPIVGISGGPDSYLIDSHTSPFILRDLTSAPTVTFSLRLPPPPELRVLSFGTNPTVNSGQDLPYSVFVNNNGPSSATDSVLDVTLSSGQTFLSCTGGISCQGPAAGADGGVVHFNLGTMGPRSGSQLQILVKVTGGAGSFVYGITALSCSRPEVHPPQESTGSSVISDLIQSIAFYGAVRISATSHHSLAIRESTVWSWGSNFRGSIGDGTTTAANRTYPVQTRSLNSVIAISGGNNFSLALRSDGSVWSWGTNEHGELGTGSATPDRISAPVKVNLTSVVAIVAGESHALAVKSDGTVWAWGAASSGELGNGSADFDPHPTPTQVSGLTNIVGVAAGSACSFAIDRNGALWSWGSNTGGRLGEGTATILRTTPVQAVGISNVRFVSAGETQILALTNDSNVWSWGSNVLGQLGLGTADLNPHPVPTKIPGLQATAVAAGGSHSLALKADGTVWAWGLNTFGELGNGEVDPGPPPPHPHPDPLPVSGLSNVIAIAAGSEFSLALISDSANGSLVKSWGRGGYLGDGATASQFHPVSAVEALVVSSPIMSSGGGIFPLAVNVSVSCGTPGATIHYTTNGSDPLESDPVIASGASLFIDRNLTVKVKGWKNGFAPSLVSSAEFTVLSSNAIDDSRNFVRQHYLDFLNRNPDQGGWDFWTAKITQCGLDAACIHSERIGVSAAFFIELEFQQTGYVVYRFYRAAYGTKPGAPNRANITFQQFIADRGLLVGGSGLPQNTINLANNFVARPEFKVVYPDDGSITNAEFVNKLFDTANLNPYTAERQQQIDAMNNNGKTRAQVLLDVIEINEFKTREYNPAFVLMQYFGYLRRNPDQGGYDFWLNILNSQPDNFRGMVCSFLTSTEYQQRFGTAITRSNQDCGQ